MLSIQTNVNSMNAQENLRTTNLFQGRTIARLTSGYRINESGDDAAGLAIANKYRSDVSELVQGVRNANDGLSTLQIIDGGLNNISKILDRLKTLATQSASDSFTGARATLDAEYTSLITEINRQADNIKLGATNSYAADISVYIGGGSSAANAAVTVALGTEKVDATTLTIAANILTKASADTALTQVNAAVAALGVVQGIVGTGENQLAYGISLAQSQITSFSAAESRIRDADVAQEAANLTKAQVLQQASLAALAQANSAPQAVLSLLRS
jgi:flagellin